MVDIIRCMGQNQQSREKQMSRNVAAGQEVHELVYI